MDFSDALRLLKRGRRVTRPGLPANVAWIAISNGDFVWKQLPGGELASYEMDMADMLADDWEDMEDIL